MIYKGIEYSSNYFRPYTLNDIPESVAHDMDATDSFPRMSGEPMLSYRKRIVQHLNNFRAKISSFGASVTHNTEKLELQALKYNPNPSTGFFASKSSEGNYLQPEVKGIRYGGPREFTTLDIETDDKGNPITVSALKQAFNRETGKFETIDTFQRFYHAKNAELSYSGVVHGLTSAKLKRLRSLQYRAGGYSSPTDFYGKRWSEDEAGALKSFLGSSVIIGHNIVDFDLPHLFKTPLNNQTIDTMTLARNAWKGVGNKLDDVFYRLFGKTMEQAGLPHHDSMSDVIANAMIAQEMVRLEGHSGQAMRYVMTHAGTHIAPEDEYIKSMVMKGIYSDYKKGVGGYIPMKEYEGIRIGDIVSAKQLGGKYNEDTGRYDLPEGMHGVRVNEGEEYPSDLSGIGNFSSDASLLYGKDSPIAGVLNRIHEELQSANEASVAAQETFQLGKIGRDAAMLDRLSRLKDVGAIRAELSDLGINARGDQEAWTAAALRRKQRKLDARIANQQEAFRAQAVSRVREMGNKGWISPGRVKEILALDNPEDFQNAYNYAKFEHDRDRRVNKAVRHGQITESQGSLLKLTKSYEELDDAMDETILKNEKLNKIYRSISSIPMYNLERLEQVFKGEVHGIMGAARGVVPNMIYNPMSRLVKAGMNAWNERLAYPRAAYRTLDTVGGAIMGAGMATGHPLAMALGGILKVGSQIGGNIAEAKVTRWGEGIQNNFNTLGFIQEMALMPFRLLRAAIDKVIKGLGILAGALAGLTKLMTSGLTNMMSMGNPITGLTGMDYGAYAGSLSADVASLLGKGTINNMFNDFATQRMQLYTTGQLNTNRLIGASMLGVFDQVYGNTMDEESSFNSMVDALIKRTSKETPLQRKQSYMMANMINPNLAAILQSANTLGVDSYEALKRPRGMWRYEEADLNRRRAGWQGAQWEYQFAGMQRGFTMNRVATALWNGPAGWGISGKGLYNGFNKVFSSVADALETGKWEKVGETIKNLWDTIVTGAEGAWTSIKKIFNIEGDASPWQMLVSSFAKIGVKAIDIFKDTILPAINNVWDSITDLIINKITGIAEFLSTIRIDKGEFINQVILHRKSDKPWITSLLDTTASGLFNKKDVYKSGTSESLDSFLEAASIFHTKAPGVMPGGIYQALRTTGKVSRESLVEWISAARNLSPENRKILNELVTQRLGEGAVITDNINPEEFLDYLARKDINPAAAGAIHGRQSQEDIDASNINRGANKIVGEYRRLRSPIEEMVSNETRNTMEHLSNPANVPPLLNITVRDDKNKKEAEATLFADGSVNTRDYNGNVVLSGQDGVFTLTQYGSTKMVGAGY